MQNIEKLYKIFKQFPTITIDSRNIPKNSIFFALKGERFNGNVFSNEALKRGASFSVIDEEKYKINDNCILVSDVLKTLQELAQYHRKQLKTQVIGITGTNGKTTTKELINVVLSKEFKTFATKGNLNNHIGVPLSVLSIRQETEIAIIEMGANHIGEIADLCKISQPDFGIITNIGKAHLEGFGSFDGIIKAKSELYYYIRNQKGKIFINADNQVLQNISQDIDKINYSDNQKDFCRGEVIEANPFIKLKANIDQHELVIQSQLIGSYNFENILAAICIGNYFKVKPEKIKSAIEEYQPDNNRSQFVKTLKNQLILDAYNANPTSMEAAIKNFGELKFKNKIAFIGDMLELGNESNYEHSKIIDLLHQQDFKQVILIGKVFASLNSEYKKFVNVESAYDWLKANPVIGAIVLVKGSRGIKLEKLIDLL